MVFPRLRKIEFFFETAQLVASHSQIGTSTIQNEVEEQFFVTI